MFTTYMKYISLLLFSGLILTFYQAAAPSASLILKNVTAGGVFNAKAQRRYFSVVKDVILPLFPVLNKSELLSGNKK